MKSYNLIIYCFILLFAIGCASSKVSTSSYYASATTYINDKGDGSITVRAYGHGKNRSDAIEQAAKNAVRDVIFKGVTVPNNTLLSKPLVTEVNAAEKFQDFFNAFFADSGAYARFVSNKDRHSEPNDNEDRRSMSDNKEKNTIQVKLATTIRVLRADLKNYLMDNGIIIP